MPTIPEILKFFGLARVYWPARFTFATAQIAQAEAIPWQKTFNGFSFETIEEATVRVSRTKCGYPPEPGDLATACAAIAAERRDDEERRKSKMIETEQPTIPPERLEAILDPLKKLFDASDKRSQEEIERIKERSLRFLREQREEIERRKLRDDSI